MSNLIPIQENSYYYFKSDAISVYPCAYRGSDAAGKFFDPASRYTSEKNLTGAVVGLVPNGTYISYIPLEILKGTSDTWKFTIGGYNFEAKIDTNDLDLMRGGKAVMFEIKPDEPSELAGLGSILTSFEPTAGIGSLDQIPPNSGSYCFTGLKVTVITTGNVVLQPTSTQLTPVLYTGTTLILNQCARLPEITHGLLDGEAKVAKLTVGEAVVENTSTASLEVENQLVVGTGDTGILKVAQNSGNPTIEVNQASVTIYTDTDTEEAKALSVAGGAEIQRSLTVTEGLSAANGAFNVDGDGHISTELIVDNALSAGTTTIKGNLTVQDSNDNEKFSIINDQTTVTTDKLTITGATEGSALKVEMTGNATINGTLDVTGGLSVNNTVNGAVNTTFIVNSAGELVASSMQAGTLRVPSYDEDNGELIPSYTSLILGPKVTNDNVTTRSFYFNDGAGEYAITPTIAKAALLNMIYPVGSIYMTMEDLVSKHELSSIDKDDKTGYAIFDPSNKTNPAGGLWKRISKGRVLLGAGEGTDLPNNTATDKDGESIPVEGGYYASQLWEHTHGYDKIAEATDECTLTKQHLPRKEFTLQFYVAESGMDKENILRWCGGSGIDSATVKDASGSGSNARIGGTQVYTGNDKWSETEGRWTFHYGADALFGPNAQTGHAHNISRTANESTTTAAGGTLAYGNLPPYSVCYIWQRIM